MLPVGDDESEIPTDPDSTPNGVPPAVPPSSKGDPRTDKKSKEVNGTIDLGKLAQLSGVHLWRAKARDEVTALYETPRLACRWMLDLEVPTATLTTMGEFGEEFDQRDAELTKAFNVMME
eukprot:16447093-Heterocapsa_arctica.AAC.1